MYGKAKAEIRIYHQEEGENACDEANVHGVHPEIVKLLGKLRYRTNYGSSAKHYRRVANQAPSCVDEFLDISSIKWSY